MNIVCFHNPNEENGYLSNWYLSEFECDGIRFSSMEQYMMFQIIMKQSGMESDRLLFTRAFVQNFKTLN